MGREAQAQDVRSWFVCGGTAFNTCSAVVLTVGTADGEGVSEVVMNVWNLSGSFGTYGGTVFTKIGFFHIGGVLALTEPPLGMEGPVRIRKDDFDFSFLADQKQEHSLDNFLILLDEILAYVPHAWNREPALEFLRELQPQSILRFKEEEVTNFDRWLLEWVRLEGAGTGNARGSKDGR